MARRAGVRHAPRPTSASVPTTADMTAGEPNVFSAIVEAVEPGPTHWAVKVRYAGKEIEGQAKAGQTYTFGPDLKAL